MKKLLGIVVLGLMLSGNAYADEGLDITCLNMKTMLGQKSKPLKFRIEATAFYYFDEIKGELVAIKSSELIHGKDSFTVRFDNYEWGFQETLFEGDTKKTLTMSKYDYKNDKFLEHYACKTYKS